MSLCILFDFFFHSHVREFEFYLTSCESKRNVYYVVGVDKKTCEFLCLRNVLYLNIIRRHMTLQTWEKRHYPNHVRVSYVSSCLGKDVKIPEVCFIRVGWENWMVRCFKTIHSNSGNMYWLLSVEARTSHNFNSLSTLFLFYFLRCAAGLELHKFISSKNSGFSWFWVT